MSDNSVRHRANGADTPGGPERRVSFSWKSSRKLAAEAKPAAAEDEAGGDGRVLLAVFVAVIGLLVYLYRQLPPLSAADRDRLRLDWSIVPPRFSVSLQQLQDMNSVLQRYRDAHYYEVLGGFCALYIFLQMFAIPGAIFLSVLAGPLFGVLPGLCIVSAVATTGASMCYGLSSVLGRGLVSRWLPAPLAKFRGMVSAQRSNLVWYLLFLRVSPLLPNWFINVASPILNIPLRKFVLATLFGLIPANYLHVTTGLTLSEITDIKDITQNYKRLLLLLGLAFFALIPTLFKKKFAEMNDRLAAAGNADGNANASGNASANANGSAAAAAPAAPAAPAAAAAPSAAKPAAASVAATPARSVAQALSFDDTPAKAPVPVTPAHNPYARSPKMLLS